VESGRHYAGYDIEERYLEIARERIAVSRRAPRG